MLARQKTCNNACTITYWTTCSFATRSHELLDHLHRGCRGTVRQGWNGVGNRTGQNRHQGVAASTSNVHWMLFPPPKKQLAHPTCLLRIAPVKELEQVQGDSLAVGRHVWEAANCVSSSHTSGSGTSFIVAPLHLQQQNERFAVKKACQDWAKIFAQ